MKFEVSGERRKGIEAIANDDSSKQQRFIDKRVDGLHRDKTRKSGTSRTPKKTVRKLEELALSPPPDGKPRWTVRALAKEVGISASTAHGILVRYRLVPHRWRYFNVSNIPNFAKKSCAIIGVYIDPPDRAVVLSIEEKTQVQVLERTHKSLPMKSGQLALITHDYGQDKILTLLNPLKFLDSTIIGHGAKHKNFITFLDQVDKAVPTERSIHAILDNHALHRRGPVRNWLAKHLRWTFNFTSANRFWMDDVEVFFNELGHRHRPGLGFCDSVELLETSIWNFIEEHIGKEAKFYSWMSRPKYGMNVFSEVKSLVLDSLRQLANEGLIPADVDLSNVTVERPKHQAHGELATNAAIVIARSAERNPRELAEELATKLRSDERIVSVEIAGPGFLNIELQPSIWMSEVRSALEQGLGYGRSEAGKGLAVNLEFVSANPTGPLHMGHARGAVFGDALGRLLEFAGFRVHREYYVNDGGAQVDSLARSAFLRYLQANGRNVEFDDKAYKGDYLIPVGESLKEEFGNRWVGEPEAVWLEHVREFVIAKMLDLIREDLGALDIRMDQFFSEKSLYGSGRIEAAIDELERKNLIYEGILEPPKGRAPEDWEPRRQALLKSTEHGDDVDRPIKKSDGSWTYFAPDIAYHYDKVSRGYDELINIFGADHGGYCKRLKAVVSALSEGRMPFDIKLIQLVRVASADGPQKMSKRAGEFVKLRDAVGAVGSDVLRFVMLTRKNDAPLDFNFDEILEQSKDNPVFYVQYAHARICSVVQKLAETGAEADDASLAKANLSLLAHDKQLSFARRIAEWPRVAQIAAINHEPHRIAFYLSDLASDFHSLWALGNSDPKLKFVQEGDAAGNVARVALARGAGVVIHAALAILGVAPIKEM